MVVLDQPPLPTRATPLLFLRTLHQNAVVCIGQAADAVRRSTLSAKALGKRQRIDPDFSPVQSQLEPPSSTASPVPVQSPMSMPGSSHQPCRSPRATFISGLNPRPAGDFGDPPDTLPGYGALLTPPFMTVLPVCLQDTPVRESAICEIVHPQGRPAATCTDVSLFAKQFTHLSPARLVKTATSHHFHVHCPTIKQESANNVK
ncbi:hypothetical protein K438DRAFT_1761829 [Mycena galopus ATCC 62051]|nr:hypothetical protein K438DRAFT_1761829 [Mycena galopus ATCC 62051]